MTTATPPRMKLQYRDDGSSDWKVYLKEKKKAPLTQRSLRFAAQDADGKTSHPWKIEAQANGEIYIRGRNVFGALHASLHSSGQCHIKQRAEDRSSNVCNWRWSYGEPCLHFLFLPRWGTPIADRPDRKLWRRNDFLLGTDSNWGLAVTLVRVKNSVALKPPPPPHILFNLAQMSMAGVGETLWVVAGQIHPPCDTDDLARFLSEMSRQIEPKEELSTGQVLDLELHGLYGPDAGFIVPLQAKVHDRVPRGPGI